jgi:hypothetical protein
VRSLIPTTIIAGLVMLAGCSKTGNGEYEIRRPVIGTKIDTLHGPTVETGTVKDTITVPKVTTEKKEVEVPRVKVRREP